MRGPTTAASLWVVAAIGTATAAGEYSWAVATTAIVLLSLWPLRRLAALAGVRRKGAQRLALDLAPEARVADVVRAVEDYGVEVESARVGEEGDAQARAASQRPSAGDRRAARRGRRRPGRPERRLGPLVKALLASTNEHKLSELRQRSRAGDPHAGRIVAGNRRPRRARRSWRTRASRPAGGARRRRTTSGRWGGFRHRGRRARRAAGVESARWAEDGVARLLAELAEATDRRAHVCSLVEDGRTRVVVAGTMPGRVTREPRGQEGFGYDPIFVPEGEARPVAYTRQRLEDRDTRTGLARRPRLLRRSPAPDPPALRLDLASGPTVRELPVQRCPKTITLAST